MKYKIGGLNAGILQTTMMAIILIAVLFQLLAGLLPEAQHAGNNLSATSLPLASLFSGTGIVFLIIMASILILVVKVFWGGKK